jgi:hypothetical protein
MGLDYGRGLTNIDPETKIRYGIISLNAVMQAWCDSSEPHYSCKSCEEDEETCEADCEPSSWYIDDGEYQAETCFDGTEIMITKSPYFTGGNYCSPCAPGAISLDEAGLGPCDDKAYCFNHDWFEGERAPYRVFLVATGKEVLP